jgi:hypothetical protein
MKRVFCFLISAFCFGALAQSPSVLLFGRRSGSSSLTNTDTPDSFAELVAWYKADALVGLADGDPVSTWIDSSGAGLNDTPALTLTSASTARPLYKTNLYGANLPCVRFDGVDDWMTNLVSHATGPGFFITDSSSTCTGATFIVVGKSTADNSCAFGNTSANYQMRVRYNGSNVMQTYNNAGGTDKNSGAVFSKAKGALIFYAWRFFKSGATQKDWSENGSEIATYTAGGSTDKAFNFTALGKDTGGAIPFGGDMCEVMIYARNLSDANLLKLFLNMSEKWGISP